MFTKPEQRETVRFSNYSGLSFSLSCSSFGRAPPHGLPPAPSRCSTAVDLESRAGGLRKSATSRDRAGSTGSGFLPQQEPGAQAGHSRSHIPSCSIITRAHGTHVRQPLEPWECCRSVSIHIFRGLNPSVLCQGVKHQHRLSREVGDNPCLESSKVRLGGVLSTLVWWKVSTGGLV